MSTQLRSTPAIRGKEAEKILDLVNRKATVQSQEKFDRIMNYFKELEEKINKDS